MFARHWALLYGAWHSHTPYLCRCLIVWRVTRHHHQQHDVLNGVVDNGMLFFVGVHKDKQGLVELGKGLFGLLGLQA